MHSVLIASIARASTIVFLITLLIAPIFILRIFLNALLFHQSLSVFPLFVYLLLTLHLIIFFSRPQQLQVICNQYLPHLRLSHLQLFLFLHFARLFITIKAVELIFLNARVFGFFNFFIGNNEDISQRSYSLWRSLY